MNGITFGDKHTYDDWGLILTARPEISSPAPKTVLVDLEGSDGSIDLTESLTGDVAYQNRSFKAEFHVMDNRREWSALYSEIMDYLHGQKMQVIFDEDPSYYYVGRIIVDEWASEYVTAKIVLSGELEPYKYEITSSLEDWLWDPFSFVDGVIRDYRNLSVATGSNRTLVVDGCRKPVVPTFIVTLDSEVQDATMNVWSSTNNKTYTLVNGRNRIPYIIVRQNGAQFRFTGDGTVSVDYRGGRL